MATSSVYVTTDILRKHNIDHYGHTLSTTLNEEQSRDIEGGTTTDGDGNVDNETKGE